MKNRAEILDNIDELIRLLSDRISDLHEIKTMQAERHAFVLYRERLNKIKKLVVENKPREK